MSSLPHSNNSAQTRPSKAVHAYVLQVIVVTNHMNGKDTHIRGLRILGPEEFVNAPFCLTQAHASPQKGTRSLRYQRSFSVDDCAFQDVQTDSLGLINGTVLNNTIFKEYIKYLLVGEICSTKGEAKSSHAMSSTWYVRTWMACAHHGDILGLGSLVGGFTQRGIISNLVRGWGRDMSATCHIRGGKAPVLGGANAILRSGLSGFEAKGSEDLTDL